MRLMLEGVVVSNHFVSDKGREYLEIKEKTTGGRFKLYSDDIDLSVVEDQEPCTLEILAKPHLWGQGKQQSAGVEVIDMTVKAWNGRAS